jgi:hypothetical protein
MKMLEGLSSGNVNPDMYFELLDVEKYKIPQKVIQISDELPYVSINDNRQWLGEGCIKNMLIDINQSVTRVYSYWYGYSDAYVAYIFYYICKTKDSYILIEYKYDKWPIDVSICKGKSWKSLMDFYESPKHNRIIRANLFYRLLINNDYDTDLIGPLDRAIEHFTTFIKLSLC